MSNLLKYTAPTWNDHVYGYNNSVLDIRTSDSVIRIFGMLNFDLVANEELMRKLVVGNTETISISDLNRFAGGDKLNLESVYNAWTQMETENNAPHIIVGVWDGKTYCVWIDSWTNPNTMTLSGISYYPPENSLRYLTQTQDTSSLLALSMLNNTIHGWIWKDNIEHYSKLNIYTREILVRYRYNLNPVPTDNQNYLFKNWTTGGILISLNDLPSHNLFDAQVYDPVLASSANINWIKRTSSTGETCTLATDLSSETRQCTIVNSSVIWYKTAPYHPVSRMMDTNYKGVYTTSKKDTIFINGGSYKTTSLLKYTDKLLRKD